MRFFGHGSVGEGRVIREVKRISEKVSRAHILQRKGGIVAVRLMALPASRRYDDV